MIDVAVAPLLIVRVAVLVAVPPLPPNVIVPVCVPDAKPLADALTETVNDALEPAPMVPLDGVKLSQDGPLTFQLRSAVPVFWTK
jgi:hypothetical protein